ncbi:hypothetical protein vseg_019748 [Gypsophila vaccaria]
MSSNLYTSQCNITILFILLSVISSSYAADNANFTICSTSPFSCGKIQNVQYPFWGGDRPQFCGIQNFELKCVSAYPFIYHVGTDGPDSLGGKVIKIHTDSHRISVVQSQFSYGDNVLCEKLIKNETVINLSKPFSFSPLVTNISLFFDCDSSIEKYRKYYQSFSCTKEPNDSEDPTIYYVAKYASRISKSCQTRRVFPVMKSWLVKMSKGNGSILEVLRKGFQLEYKVDDKGCSECQKSGGLCGSSDSANTAKPTFLCYCPNGEYPLACPKSEKKSGIYIASGVGGGTLLVFVAVVAICCRKHLKFSRPDSVTLGRSKSEHGMESINLGVPIFSNKELEEATHNFDQTRELGGGGFGTVYYGKLKDGREVAVKRLYEKSFKRVEQFMNEVRILTCLRHQNLVSLYGCTSCHSRELLLVYEYVSNGTVADHLYGCKENSGSLSWTVRLNIAIETASALSYLHASDIIHRDVKTNNILLDKNFNVKVADFGLSRLFPNNVTHVSTAPQGTPGYLDPEYHQCYQLTDKSDVYSFGVVLVELLSSLRAVDMDRNNYEINLSTYAMNRIKKCEFAELVNPKLRFESDFKVRRMTTSVAELAFQCLQHYKDFRPSMDEVLDVLKRIQSFDYEALQIEETGKNDVQITTDVLPSPTNDDEVKPLRDHLLWRQSPTSVMEIVSSSTTSESKSS